MLVITCPVCAKRQLIGNRRIRRIHNTAAGPMGRVSCNADHPLLHDFRRDSTTVVPQ